MNRKKVTIGLLVGVGGLAMAAHQLFSFQLDAAGVKSMARAWILHNGEEAGIAEASRTKVAHVAERAIDSATPVLTDIYHTLGELGKDQQDGPGSKNVTAHLDHLFAGMGRMIDVKDSVAADARQSLSPRERAEVVAKVSARVKANGALKPSELEQLLDALRVAHRASIRSYLQLDDQRVSALEATMQTYVDQRKQVRAARADLVEKIQTAVHAGAGDDALAAIMGQWDQLTAKGSAIGRAQLAAARKSLSDAELGRLASRAHYRIEKVLWVVSLIQKFHPVM